MADFVPFESHIRNGVLFYFNAGLSATETTNQICDIYGDVLKIKCWLCNGCYAIVIKNLNINISHYRTLEMDKLEIRKAKREDCKAIRSLIQELANFEKMPNAPEIDHKQLEEDGFDTDMPKFMCFVAALNEILIGYTVYYYTYSTWYGKAMYMEDLYVTSKYRKQHVATKLLQAIAKLLDGRKRNESDVVEVIHNYDLQLGVPIILYDMVAWFWGSHCVEALSNNCCRLDFSVLKWNPACDFYAKMGAMDITEQEKWHHYRVSKAQLKNLIMIYN